MPFLTNAIYLRICLVDISGQKLNNGDEYRNLKFQLYRWKATAMESVLWGEFEINGNEILEGGEKVKSIGNKSGSDISARLNQGNGLISFQIRFKLMLTP